jgi:hypothetical protein
MEHDSKLSVLLTGDFVTESLCERVHNPRAHAAFCAGHILCPRMKSLTEVPT